MTGTICKRSCFRISVMRSVHSVYMYRARSAVNAARRLSLKLSTSPSPRRTRGTQRRSTTRSTSSTEIGSSVHRSAFDFFAMHRKLWRRTQVMQYPRLPKSPYAGLSPAIRSLFAWTRRSSLAKEERATLIRLQTFETLSPATVVCISDATMHVAV